MDDESSIIKLVIVGVAAYLGYNWLQSSGLWAQWFGGSSSFTTAPALLAYCQANPSGTASFNGQSAPCASWMQAAAATAPAGTPTVAAAPSAVNPTPAPVAAPPAHVTPLTVNQLLNAVAAAGYASSASITFDQDQWNYFVTTAVDQNAIVDIALPGYVPGALITAAEYIQMRQQAGVSGIRRAVGFVSPYGWKM